MLRSRLFQWFAKLLLVLTAIAINGIFVPPPAYAATSCPLQMSKPYRSPANSVVYLVTTECTRRPFFNPDVYFSFFTSWNDVTFIEQVDMDKIPDDILHFVPWGPLRTFKNGSLVKLTSNPFVYLLEDGKAYPLADENAFKAFGYSFDQVEDVTSATLAKFTIQTNPIKNANDAPASLVFKYPNGPNVYLLKQKGDQLVKTYLTSMDQVNASSRGDRIAILPLDATFPNADVVVPTADAIAPTITSFNFPAPSSTSLIVPIGAIIATDNIGVTGYYVSESSSTPSINNSKWTSSTPTEYAFSTTGTKTLYAWAKDAIGNISTSTVAIVTIVNSSADITPPIISSVASTPIPAGFTISWKTNEASTSYISYGSTTAYDHTTSSKDLVTSHTAIVMNVYPGTVYHFRISSTDASSNTQTTGDYTETPKKDVTPPTITAFSIPASSTSMVVPISAFTASDDVGVTAYALTKTNTAPLLTSSDWLSAPPATYDFARAGSVSLYAWARDASGNVSTGRLASSVITTGMSYPTISSISATPSSGSVTVTWVTSQPAKSVLQYGTNSNYGTQITNDSYIAAHSATLTGLSSGTYHYYITATNSSGAEQNSGDLTVIVP